MIRPAGAGDATAVAAIWNPVIRDTTITFNPVERSPDEVAAMIAARRAGGQVFLVAEAAGEVAGFVTTFPFRAGAGYAHTLEHTLVLAPASRGRGLGRALLTHAEAAARAGGAHTLWAAVSAENAAGAAFHRAMGYAEVARLPEAGRKFGRWIDLILFVKRL